MRKSRPKGMSLRWGLLAIMALCWIVPVVVILLFSSYSITNNLQGHIKDTITTSVDIAFQQTQDKISGAMDASRASSYDDTIYNAYTEYQKDNDGVILYDTVTKYLLQQYGYDNRFNATFLFFTADTNKIYYANNRMKRGEVFSLHNYKNNIHHQIIETYPDLSTSIGFVPSGKKLYMVRNIVDSSFEPYAVIVMECNETVLFESIRSIVWLKSAVVNIDGIMRNVVGEEEQQKKNNDGIWYNSSNGNYTIRESDRISGHTISLSVISDSASLIKELPNVGSTLPWIGLFAIPLLLFVMWAYYHYVSKPVEVLVDAAAHMEAGERGYVVDKIPQSREFRYLTERFNSMSVELRNQFERIYQEQLELQKARVSALRSQINPHFLNNTLEVILWEARMAKDEKVCSMIEALSTMLDAATARKGGACGTVEQELAYADAYLYILSVRLGKRLTVSRKITPETLKMPVPCLILQPIVENAIEHGITPRQKGNIELRSMLKDNMLILEVENDGHLTKAQKQNVTRLLSMDGEPSTEDNRECIGIYNVNRRLKLLYGDEGGLTITETSPGKVLARILIPHVGSNNQTTISNKPQ